MLFPQRGIGGDYSPPPLLESRLNLQVICHCNEVGQRFTCPTFISSCSLFGFITAWKLISVQNEPVQLTVCWYSMLTHFCSIEQEGSGSFCSFN